MDCLGFLVAAARLVDLQVARGDGHRVSCARSDLHHNRAANHDFQVELVAAAAALRVVDGPALERNVNLVGPVAAVRTHNAFAMEVNDVDSDLGGPGGHA